MLQPVLAVVLSLGLLLSSIVFPKQAFALTELPSWWTSDCNGQVSAGNAVLVMNDANLGLQICYPINDQGKEAFQGSQPDIREKLPHNTATLEWECTELAGRYLAQHQNMFAGGPDGGGNVPDGKDVAASYYTWYTSTRSDISLIDGAQAGTVPTPLLPSVGDVLSTVNHTGVIASVAIINATTGDATITLDQENAYGNSTTLDHSWPVDHIRIHTWSYHDLDAPGGPTALSNVQILHFGSPPLLAPSLVSPANTAAVQQGEPVTLQWSTSGAQSRVLITAPDGSQADSGWQTATSFSYTPPRLGTYSWSVTTTNASGQHQQSTAWSFTVWPPDVTPAVFMGTNGMPDVVARDTSELLWQTSAVPDGTSVAWSHVGTTPVISNPVISGNMVFARAITGQMMYAFLRGGTPIWKAISNDLPIGATSAPAIWPSQNAESIASDVFALGGDGHVYHSTFDTNSTSWTPWIQIGTPAAAVVGTPVLSGDQMLYMRDITGQIEQALYDNIAHTWHWSTIGDILPAGSASAPAITVSRFPQDSNADIAYPGIFAVGGNGKLYHTSMNSRTNAWTPWQSIPVAHALQETPVITADGQLYARDTNGQIEQGTTGQNGDWHWSVIGSQLPAGGVSGPALLLSPTGVKRTAGSLDAYAVGGDGQIYCTVFTNAASTWTPWISVGNATPAFSGGAQPAPALLPSPQPAITAIGRAAPTIYARGTDNDLWKSTVQVDGTDLWDKVGTATLASNPVVYGANVYARDPNGQIMQARLADDTWSTVSSRLMAGATSEPLVSSPNILFDPNADSSFPDVFALSGDGKLYHSYVSTTIRNWTPWTLAGTTFTALVGTPVIFADHILYMRDVNGQIEQATYNERRHAWEWQLPGNSTLNGAGTTNPVLAILDTTTDPDVDTNYPDIVALGGDGNLYSTFVSAITGTWTDWQQIQSMPAIQGTPAIDNAEHMYVRDANGQIEAGYDDALLGWQWEVIGNNLPSGGLGTPVLTKADRTIDPDADSDYPDVYAVGGDGQLYHCYVSIDTVSWTDWQQVSNVSVSFK